MRELQFYEWDVKLRLPFRFGVVTLAEEPQILHSAEYFGYILFACSSVAQLVEHPAVNRRVVGSSPT